MPVAARQLQHCGRQIGRAKRSAPSITGPSSNWFSTRSKSIASFTIPPQVQLCQLLSIKTGGCPEDCAYCPQSAHYQTGVEHQGLLGGRRGIPSGAAGARGGRQPLLHGRGVARSARRQGVRHGARNGARVASLGLEVCCTLGMLTDDQARRLAARASRPTTTTSTPRRNFTADHHHAPSTKTGCARLRRCARRASPCAAAASSAWANPTRTASACCINWRRSIRIRRACPSTCWCAWRALRWATPSRWIR